MSYAEKRWQRLLMIALAMLPSFTTTERTSGGDSGLQSYPVYFSFMLFSCTLAYTIKLFYFDVVDDSAMVDWLQRGGCPSPLRSRHRRGIRQIGSQSMRGSTHARTA